MFIYAGIDEAGYGPFFGPLTVGCCVLSIPKLEAGADPPDLWRRLNKAVCKTLTGRKGRVVVNDSKKLTTKAAGIAHLETGCLAFAAMADHHPEDVGRWLDAMGAEGHRGDAVLPWYAATADRPWQALPDAADPGQLAIARGLLATTAHRIGVQVEHLGVQVVFEDRFNEEVQTTRSKAAVSFTRVAGHLLHIWQHHSQHRPTVVVDRQSGRSHYRRLLADTFADCNIDIVRETPAHSSYEIWQNGSAGRRMLVHFQTQAESDHMPTALASMLAKYTRELLMHRFQAWFAERLPEVAPTKGYGSDAKRFWQEVRGELGRLNIDPLKLRRQA
jgi:ribonuclease HII